VLPLTTGWPLTYLHTGQHPPAWADAVRQQFSDFFLATAPS